MKTAFRASVVLGFVGIAFFAMTAAGEAQISLTWLTTGTASATDPNNPSIGNGSSTTSAASGSLYGTMSSAVTLGVGDTLSFSGTFVATGIVGNTVANGFRWGMEYSNHSSNTTGWLGYWAGNPDSQSGSGYGFVMEENVSNTSDALSSGGGTNFGGAAKATNSNPMSEGTYTFSLQYKRTATNTLQITVTLNNGLDLASNPTTAYIYTNTLTDGSVNTWVFDSVALNDSSTASKLVSFSNLAVTYTAAPEPGTTALLGAAGVGLACAALRRKALASR